MKNYLLIETFSGSKVYQAETLEELRDYLDESLAAHYSVHCVSEGWFASATILYRTIPRHKTGVRQ